MSTRTLTSIPITNPSLIRSRYPVRLAECCAVASIRIRPHNFVQVRTFWGRGWKHAWYHNHYNRVNRRQVLDDLAKDYREQYVLTRRMWYRGSKQQQSWNDWKDSSKQSRREQDYEGRDPKRHRYYWNGDMGELVKMIERDPYNFLFGRSNEYLQMGKGWFPFGRSFLDPESSPEVKRDTSSAHAHSVNATVADVSSKTSSKEADGDVIELKAYKPSNADIFRYDPISGRMKPVEESVEDSATETTRHESNNRGHATDISFKVYTGEVSHDHVETSNQESSKLSDSLPTTKNSAFRDNEKSVFSMGTSTAESDLTIKDTSSILPQTQNSKDTMNGQKKKTKKKLEYELKEVTEDDVDLLRASDIRASFFAGETKEELAEKKKQAREAMEQDYARSTYQNIDDEVLRDLRRKKDAMVVNQTVMNVENPTKTADQAQPQRISQAEKLEATHRRDDSSTTVSNASATTSALSEPLDGFLQDTKLFVNNVQALANDIQVACERVEAAADTSPDTLRILAFDSASSQIVCAETASSVHANESPRHAADVLLHLNNPAKFLPYFAKMKADGYEIVAGGGDILIFRKTDMNGLRSVSTQSANVENITLSKEEGAVEEGGTAVLQDSNFTSQSSPKIDRSGSRVARRQETVFTGGPPNWSPYESISSSTGGGEKLEYTQTEQPTTKTSTASRLGNGLRRIVLSGVATAGTFYAIGVVCEYFLTGGQDGRGPEGFSEFEAERRRRE